MKTDFWGRSCWMGVLCCCVALAQGAQSIGNRLTYLDETDPFYVHSSFPKLTTPQWVGEAGVEAVVILAIDDMRAPAKYEEFLRPILERLKKIDGRAPVSIFCNALDPAQQQYQTWIAEGVSLEVHTLAHPCPLLAKGDFPSAAETYHGCVDLLHHVVGNKPVAFRMPCCDSINSPSPRFYAEIFNRTNSAGQFLTIDSSVMNITTSQDQSLPRNLTLDPNGRERFRKYVPFPSFVTTIENYPYPYVIGKLCWEFPGMAPSDWEAQHLHGVNNPQTVADWKAALDVTVLKKGVFNFIFHPHGWIKSEQMVEFIDYAVTQYGPKVKFLTFREAEQFLNRGLLDGHAIRNPYGQDNGVRLVDINMDGFLDVIIANQTVTRTRIWNPTAQLWTETSFPVALIAPDPLRNSIDLGVRFGVLQTNGHASVIVRNENIAGAWHWRDGWVEDKGFWAGLEANGSLIFTAQGGQDRGARLRDVDGDGRCEVVVANATQNAVLAASEESASWKALPFALPPEVRIVTTNGLDTGLRFQDINEDGYDDLLISNEERYSLHLYVPKLYLGFQPGWSRLVFAGIRSGDEEEARAEALAGGSLAEIPAIVREGGINNGAWFHSRHLWVQNENTSSLSNHVARRSYQQLLGGLLPEPKEPDVSLASIQTHPDFLVQLVAAEPFVIDPVAFEWGPDGKLWVVEMRDYPSGVNGQPGGVIRYLEDTDLDGAYDQSRVFLSGVPFPTGVMPWKNGVLISAAPDIFYAEDTNGDGKADLKQVLYTGFGQGNQQHRVNGFEYGLDNWIYGANGDSGGKITAGPDLSRFTSAQKQNFPLDLSGRDFRFHPETGLFQAIAGQTQFGRRRDDWGNWFGNNNPTWVWHYYIPEDYLARNKFLPVRSSRKYLANYPESTRVFPLSQPLQRFNDIGMQNHVTSGCSPSPYRDDLFGPEFENSIFISEPVHNLVHREKLVPQGVTFTSSRGNDEQRSEFLASTDNWFRPIMIKTGPDGALYIADMYRLVLEHPEWIPPDTQKSLDVRAGSDRGRIYRVMPKNARLRHMPRLDLMDVFGLVKAMDSPNGWQRDTAQKLLVQKRDISSIASLDRLARLSLRPQTRIHALWTLHGMGELNADLVISRFKDPHPAVREHAIHTAETFLKNNSAAKAIGEALLPLAEDPEVRVVYQLAFTLGEWNDHRAAEALADIGGRFPADENIRLAILSSAVPHLQELLDRVAHQFATNSAVEPLFLELVALAAAMDKTGGLAKPLGEFAARHPVPTTPQLQTLGRLLDLLGRRNIKISTLQLKGSKRSGGPFAAFFTQARLVARDAAASEEDRLAALALLGRNEVDLAEDRTVAAQLLGPGSPASVQAAALAALSRTSGFEAIYIQNWSQAGPEIRAKMLEQFLQRPSSIEALLAAITQGHIPAGQISPLVQEKLINHSNKNIQARSKELFGVHSRDRASLVEQYQIVHQLTPVLLRGQQLFKDNCASCHRYKAEGIPVGPDLATIVDRSTAAMMIAILDPNRAVEAKYINYTVKTKDDREISGLMISESANSITVRTATGSEETILRKDIAQVQSSGLSLMPEGMEKVLSPQDLADLIGYLRQ